MHGWNRVWVLTIALVAASLVCRAPAALAGDEETATSNAKLAAEFNDPLTVLPQLLATTQPRIIEMLSASDKLLRLKNVMEFSGIPISPEG